MVEIGDQTEWVEKGLERLRYEYDLNPEDYCLDIGSYQMEWANEIKRRYGCEVECFEALDNRAAWVEDGVLLMGGLFYYTSAYDVESPQREFKCVDIAPFLQREVAVMKMNIEGAEYDLLDYIIRKGLHKNIKNIQVQFHKVDEMEYELFYNQIKDKLSLTHELTYCYPYVWENWQRC